MTAECSSLSEGTPLPDWIQRARYSLSKDYYTECAVEVALQLTNHLCMVAGANSNASVSSSNGSVHGSSPPLNRKKADSEQPSSLQLVKIEYVTPENVIIYGDALGNSLVATEVRVELRHSNPIDRFDNHPLLTQKDLCFALGQIFFFIFSQGASFRLVLDDSSKISDNNRSYDGVSDGSLFNIFSLEDLDVDSVTSRQSKKCHRSKKICSQDSLPTTETSSAAKFMKSKVYLEEQGFPRSICRLVSDLLQAGESIRFVSETALLSLDDVQFDLAQMKTYPHLFLRDNTCPITALRLTSLFGETDGDIYGREEEMKMLMDKAERTYLHAPPPSRISVNGGPRQNHQGDNFLCEVILLSGYSGSGKTSILKHLTSFFHANDWFVLTCKFDRQAAPLLMLVQSVDTFLARFVNQGGGQREPVIQYAFDQISRCIISSIDRESFVQLCELFPNFCKLFPMSFYYVHDRKTKSGTIDDPSLEIIDPSTLSLLAPGGLGSGSSRVKYLFSLILKAICSGGYPVSYIFEDLQWADSISMEVIGDIIQPDGYSSTFSSEEDDLSNKGLLILGSFRKNEIDEGVLINQLKTTDQISSNINFSTIYIDELPEQDINNMLSSKFCLPMRYTRGLSQIVHQKSRGHPLHIIEFLRFIISNKMMSYSVKDRRWIWDEITIDLQMISEGVVELLTRKLRQLPHNLIETLKVVACIGQINVATIKLLDLGQFVPDMLEALESATREGIVERAGPVFAFTHDLLQESTLNLIPEYEELLLRKQIGKSLVQVPDVANNAGLCTLAVDQINMCKDMDGMLDPVERVFFAQLNLAAGKHSIAASSNERGRGYFEAGISLLHSNPWDEHYSLCLELFEMSAVVNFMDGKVETVASRLDSILFNAKSYDDTLISRALRAKFLASQGQYVEAIEEVFGVLSNLGEELPGDISLSYLKSEINATQPLLKDISKDTILNLPPMTDMRKLNTMKFMVRSEGYIDADSSCVYL
jgi:predicted ATPase